MKSPKILMTQEVKRKAKHSTLKLQNSEVFVATAAWYDILLSTNNEGKTLQSNKLPLHLALTQIKRLINFLKQ
jgi:hypothetical protein